VDCFDENDTMHVLHVLDHSVPLQSGYAYRTLSIVREQRRRGWETSHLTSAKHPAKHLEEEAEGLLFYRTRPTAALWAELPVLRQMAVVRSLEKRLEELVLRLRPDIIHAHSPALNGLAAIRVGRKLNVPVVYELRAFWEDAAVDHGTSWRHGPRYRLTRALETYVVRRADAVTAICQGIRTDLVGRGIPDEKVTVIPNAVDVDNFNTERSPDPRLAQVLGLNGGDVVGFLGSFYSYEGLSLLIDAMPLVRRKRPSIRALLVGGGYDERRLWDHARELELEGTVIFAGRVPFGEVRSYYDLVDVLVYPRMPMRLTDTVTPLKPLEAMAMGKLVLASDVGGHRELIRDGQTGFLFQAGSKEDLAAKLLSILEKKESGDRVRKQARRFVEEERTWARSVARYAPVYERLLKAKGGV
jgi:PEP-CTERM/exosortase A-associated glycosyltransferase